MKELNIILEKTLDKANNKKMAKAGKEVHIIKSDSKHQVLVKNNELNNAKKAAEKYNRDISDIS